MARARNIKPGIFKNELLGVADPLLTILFESLWCLADREGRLEDRPLRIKAETFPYRDNLDINGYLTELQRLGFIWRYSVAEQRYIQVIKFKEHQSPHSTEKASTIPARPENYSEKTDSCSITVISPLNDDGLTQAKRPDLLIPDSLNIDSLIPDLPHVDAQQAGVEAKAKRKCRLPDDFKLTAERITSAVEYWQTKNRPDLIPLDEFTKFINYHRSNGKPMLDWDACWRTWYANAIQFNKPPLIAVQGGANRQTGQARDFSQIDYSSGVDANGKF